MADSCPEQPASLYDKESLEDCTLDGCTSHVCTFESDEFVKLLYKDFVRVEELTCRSSSFGEARDEVSCAFLALPSMPSSNAAVSGASFDWAEPRAERKMFAVREAIAKALALSFDDPGDHDLAASALIDVYVDLLHFAALRSMTHLQVQQLLLLFRDTHVDVCWAERESDLASVTERLTTRLARLTSVRTYFVVETRNVEEVVVQEVVDPAAFAAHEAAVKKDKGKKGAAAASIDSLPKIEVRTTVQREIREEKEMPISPFFTAAVVRDVVGFIRATLLQHWRLFQLCATTSRVIDSKMCTVVYEDPPVQLPPLSTALTEVQYGHRLALQAVFDEFSEAAHRAFKEHTQSIDDLYAMFVVEDVLKKGQFHKEIEEDYANKMSREEFEHTLNAMRKRRERTGDSDTDFFADAQKRIARAEQLLVKPDGLAETSRKPAGGKR